MALSGKNAKVTLQNNLFLDYDYTIQRKIINHCFVDVFLISTWKVSQEKQRTGKSLVLKFDCIDSVTISKSKCKIKAITFMVNSFASEIFMTLPKRYETLQLNLDCPVTGIVWQVPRQNGSALSSKPLRSWNYYMWK